MTFFGILNIGPLYPAEMSFNLQAVTVQTVTTTFLPTLGGKKETHFCRVLVDPFSKLQKMSSPMNKFCYDILRFITNLINHQLTWNFACEDI